MDGLHDFLDGAVLDQVPHGSGLEGPGHDVAVVVHREHDDGDARLGAVDQPGGLHAVEDRHGDVHQHDVGQQLLGQAERLLAVGRLPDDVEAGVLEGSAKSFAQRAVVVGEK